MPGDLPNVALWPLQGEMTRVWCETRLLLVPSLWHESGPRVALEALSAGIPVLAADSSGPREMLNGSGFLFPRPEGGKEEWQRIAPNEAAATWLDWSAALEADPQALAAARYAADAAWADYPLVNRTDRVEQVFEGVLAGRKTAAG